MNRIIPKYLKIQNFRAFKEFEVEFMPGFLYLVKGRNGSGKSTIFNSIYTCLYNVQSNGRPASKGINEGKSAYLEFGFEHNNILYVVKRIIGSGSKVELIKDGEKLATGKKVKSIIEELIPSDILKLAMLKQVNIKELISNIVDVSNFTKKLSEKIHESELKINELNHELEKIDLELSSKKQQIENYKNNINNLQNEVLMLEKELELYNNITYQDSSELTQKMQIVNNFYTEFNKRVLNLEAEINKKISEEIDKPVNDKNLLLQKIDYQLKDLIGKLQIDKQNIAQEYNLKIHDINSKIKQNQNEIRKLKKLIEDKICFTCNRDIDSDIERFNQTISQLEDQNKQFLQQIENLKSEQLEKEKNIDNQIVDYETRARNRKSEIFNEIQELQNLKISYQQELQNLEPQKQEIYFNLLTEFNLTPEDLNINYNELISKIQNKNNIRTKIETLKTQIGNNINVINKLQQELIELEDRNNIQKIKNDIQDCQNDIEIYQTWNNTRLLKKLLVKKVGKTLNNIIQHRYSRLLELEINFEEDIEIKTKNFNSKIVDVKDCSGGETVISDLVLYSAIRDLLTIYDFPFLVLDEFLDSLDETNAFKAVQFLKELCEKRNITIFLITHREDIQSDYYNEIIDLN